MVTGLEKRRLAAGLVGCPRPVSSMVAGLVEERNRTWLAASANK
jgi:hypothetical protein